VVTSRKLAAALAMRAQGDLTMTQIAEELGVSPASLYRRLARHRQEAEVIESATASLAVEPASTMLLDLMAAEACSFGGGSWRIPSDGSCDTPVP
jgi:transposase-like protein